MSTSLYFFKNYYAPESFLPGVKLSDVPVQGHSITTASEEVDDWLEEKYNKKIIFFSDDYIYKTTLDSICYHINTDDLVKRVWDQERERSLKEKFLNIDGTKKIIYPIEVSYKVESLKTLEEQFNEELSFPSKNARPYYDNIDKQIKVKPGEKGQKVDFEATFSILPTNLNNLEDEFIRVPIKLKKTEPEITKEDLDNLEKIATYSTWFDTSDKGRSHNLIIATSAIDSTLLTPGEIFSFNEVVGKRSVETGYQNALIIIDGKFELGVGGGICQVSSTLYNSALLADLNIIERNNHTLAINYVPLGRDASVSYGLQDLKFKNNLNSPIYIRAYTEGGKLTISIYSNSKHNQKVDIINNVDEIKEFKTKTKFDESLNNEEKKVKQEGQEGYVVSSFRVRYDENGYILNRELLSRDKYRAIDKVIVRGPNLIEEETEEKEEVYNGKLDNKDLLNIDNEIIQ